MNIKRIFHRIFEEIIAIQKVAKYTSFRESLTVFRAKMDIQKLCKNGFIETKAVTDRLMKKHEVMLRYFDKTFASYLEKYKTNESSEDDTSLKEHVWVCWWQGEDKAPDIVKKCIESIRKNCINHQLTVITEENYKNYVKVPDWIEDKKNKGIISKTHFSDILRIELLAEHGGVWLDATILCVKNIDDLFDLPVWSIKRPDYQHGSIACGRFANYSLGCRYDYRFVFLTIRDFLFHYWETNNFLVDYLFLDYLIVLAQHFNKEIEDLFKAIPENNKNCDELAKYLGTPYDEMQWKMLKNETSLFKLTWKQKFPSVIEGEPTFYAKLLEGAL